MNIEQMSDLDVVFKLAIPLEKILKEKYGSEGNGLREYADHAYDQQKIDLDTYNKLKQIAHIRNGFGHEPNQSFAHFNTTRERYIQLALEAETALSKGIFVKAIPQAPPTPSVSTKNCPNCGTGNLLHASYCVNCRLNFKEYAKEQEKLKKEQQRREREEADLKAGLIPCPKCKEKTSKNAIFCANCGVNLKKARIFLRKADRINNLKVLILIAFAGSLLGITPALLDLYNIIDVAILPRGSTSIFNVLYIILSSPMIAFIGLQIYLGTARFLLGDLFACLFISAGLHIVLFIAIGIFAYVFKLTGSDSSDIVITLLILSVSLFLTPIYVLFTSDEWLKKLLSKWP